MFEISTADIIAEESAMPVALPEFRERLTKAAITPCLSEGPDEKMAALLGDRNIPDPVLKITIQTTIKMMELTADINPIINRPVLAITKPTKVKILLSYLSERIPMVGPKIIRLIAFGTSIMPTCAGFNLRADCR